MFGQWNPEPSSRTPIRVRNCGGGVFWCRSMIHFGGFISMVVVGLSFAQRQPTGLVEFDGKAEQYMVGKTLLLMLKVRCSKIQSLINTLLISAKKRS